MKKISFLVLVSLFSMQSFASATPAKIGCYSHGYDHYIYLDTVKGVMKTPGESDKVSITGSLDSVLTVSYAQNGKVVLNLSREGNRIVGNEGNSDDQVTCKDCGPTFNGCYTDL